MTLRDQDKQDLRIDQMSVSIEKMRADLRREARKFAVAAILATAAAVGAGVGIGNLIWAQREVPAAQSVPIAPPARG